MQKRAIKAEATLQEKERQESQMRTALRFANERRATAEETLNRLLEDPAIAAPAGQSSDDHYKRRSEALEGQLKAKDLQMDVLTTTFLSKEKTMEATIKELHEKLEKAQKEIEAAKASSSTIPNPEPEVSRQEFLVEMEALASTTEEVVVELPKDDTLTQLSNAEIELAALISESLEPIQKECMEWEQRILHNCNLIFPNVEDATKAYNRSILPYALLKHEVIQTKERLTLKCPIEEIGGYEAVSLDQWLSKANMQNQPLWRLAWFRKYPLCRTTYALAPRELRIDPVYCPI